VRKRLQILASLARLERFLALPCLGVALETLFEERAALNQADATGRFML
jgi:hypothetical protein